MDATAVVLRQPEQIEVGRLPLSPAGDSDVIVAVEWSGISTGTERLLFSGRMPPFPGMGYPLVPGYEAVGRVMSAGPQSGRREGERVFVPGARCFGPVRGLFGGSASRLVAPGAKVLPLGEHLAEQGTLLALAATARHAIAGGGLPDLIVGHGVLGRLLARLAVMAGGSPVVWERNADRIAGADGYTVVDPDTDTRYDYRAIYDVSGDSGLLDTLVGRLAPGGEIVLAGFYAEKLHFAFPPAFMREARFRIAAQWQPDDLQSVRDAAVSGALSLDGLITDCQDAASAPDAYRTAFGNPACLKMILDWSACQ